MRRHGDREGNGALRPARRRLLARGLEGRATAPDHKAVDVVDDRDGDRVPCQDRLEGRAAQADDGSETAVARRGRIHHRRAALRQAQDARPIENRTVMPKRAKNSTLRTREYLTEQEIDVLMAAARQNRHGHRDATMILIAFRHGLRASEVVDLRWDQVDFCRAVLHVRRTKQGTPSVHPLTGLEMRALHRLQRETKASPFVFVSERRAPFTAAGFARMMERAGAKAKFGFKAHPHMLRHACGYALANKGHDTRALQSYLGHCNIQHTVRYTELSPTRFKDFWR